MINTIRVVTWQDSVTPESAEAGDFAECGIGEQEYTWDRHGILGAVQVFMDKYRNNFWDSGSDYQVGDVLYACDPETDYQDGTEYYDRLTIDCDESLRESLQAALDAALAEG
jgi:hypothetical protein